MLVARALAIVAGIAAGGVALPGPAAPGAGSGERTTTLADRTGLDLTIYNGDLALVHDRRRVTLQRDRTRLAWRDVGAQMDATTAILEDVSVPGAVRVIEQNFDYDLLRPQTILDKYVGHEVTVVHQRAEPGRPLRETAKLLADNDGIVLQYANRIETSLDGHLEFPQLPPDLRDRPTLSLDVQSAAAGDADLDLSYLTGGLSWHADYVGVVSPDETHVDLSGLVTLSNTSGTSFEDAHLQLVAGNVNVPRPSPIVLRAMSRVEAAKPQFSQENYFEYHLYTLARTTSIGNAQTKQVSLLNARSVPIAKTLELRGAPSYYFGESGDLGERLPVGVYETFENKGGDLGVPLPAGTVRLYKSDAAGTSLFLGADTIGHTPKNETVRLHLGDSFDVTASKKQTAFSLVASCVERSSYEIRVKNAKTVAQDVLVVEPIPGDWTIEAENVPHRKTSSATATWTLRVPPGGDTTLDYTALVKTCS